MSFWHELKRRKMFQVAAVYGITAWLLVQIIVSIEEPLNLPDWMDTFVIVCLAIGFPVTLILSWAFNLTPDGLVRDAGTDVARPAGGESIEYALIALLIAAVGWLFYRDLSTGDDVAALATNSPDGEFEREREGVLPNSVAVLPCDNFSTDPENGFFAASLHEEMLNQLVKLKNLNVVARTSVLQYAGAAEPIPDIARELNVESVMECSVAYGDGRIVISAQLIDGDTGLHLWSERYNREFADVFGIQSDIAMNVANALQAAFSPEEQGNIERHYTDSPEAYALYLQASVYGGGTPSQAQTLLDQALTLDPSFAAAYARKANWHATTLVNTVIGNARADWLGIDRQVQTLANRALAIDPDLPEAYLALTFSHTVMWRWPEARAALERTLELNGGNLVDVNNAIWIYSFAGAHGEAIRVAGRRLEQAPTSPASYLQVGLAQSFAGNAEAAIPSFETALGLNATNLVARMYLAMALAAAGRKAEAVEQLGILERLAEGSPLTTEDVAAVVYAELDRVDRAKELASEIFSTKSDAANEDIGTTAMAYLALRDRDELAESLQRAVDKSHRHEPDPGFYSLMIIKYNVPHDALLEEPRFVELRRQIGPADN
jgi:TolB-like protein